MVQEGLSTSRHACRRSSTLPAVSGIHYCWMTVDIFMPSGRTWLVSVSPAIPDDLR